MNEGGGVQGMPYVLNLLYFEGCVTMVRMPLRRPSGPPCPGGRGVAGKPWDK